MAERHEVFIERWFPVDIVGAESMRERGASSALPPLFFLHVWWARRPLATSRAAILASVLPAWTADWPEALHERFPTEQKYRQWFVQLCGILGDPVAGRKLIDLAKERGVKLKVPPYSHKRAFTVSPEPETLEVLHDLLKVTWNSPDLSVLDPMAGGGSIPFESRRYGFRTCANELNPVASIILKATLDYPFRFGASLATEINRHGKLLCERIRERLEAFFPKATDEAIHAYIWARTVNCPYTGKPLPLSPNWWLLKGSDGSAAQPEYNGARVTFSVVNGENAVRRADPDRGTTRRGSAISPWAGNQAVDEKYIKAEARAGRMGAQLVAIISKRNGLHARSATAAELHAAEAAAEEATRRLPAWLARDVVPQEARPNGRSDFIGGYGFPTFASLFLPRQLLTQVTAVECFGEVAQQIDAELDSAQAAAVKTYLALALDKAADYNSGQTHWNPIRRNIANTFSLHDFRIRWNPSEFDGARNLFPWAVDQIVDAYVGITRLSSSGSKLLSREQGRSELWLSNSTATELGELKSKSVDLVTVDPPYYDNVMYAECADFFYVWMKRTLGGVHPEFFSDELTNKDDEAVANAARFRGMGRKREELALQDYERKMAAAFREMHRVLRDDGVLTVMFTHRRVEAWDTLATSLIGAGFSIRSSWPVHTESEHSLHQAKKNAARSTILLTCRKRDSSGEPVWWDDIKAKVRRVARETAAEFEQQGIHGVDLYIATFGPVLSILSESWPVLTSEVDDKTGEPKPLKPDVALDLAREEVVGLRKQGLLLGRAVEFDPVTDWYLMAWDAFRAAEFPADEARKLAIALGLSLDQVVIAEKRIVRKKGSDVILQLPRERRKKGMVDPDLRSFACWIDAAHTAMLLYEEDGARACEAFLKQADLMKDSVFRACLQALLNAIPRARKKGELVRPEAKVLDILRLAFFDDLLVPQEEEPERIEKQLELLAARRAEGEDEQEGDQEDGEDEDETAED